MRVDFNASVIVGLVAGILLCLFGWHLFRASVYYLGFILGATVGYALSVAAIEGLGDALSVEWRPLIILFAMILLGILGAFLIRNFIKVILFLAGFLFGMVVATIYTGARIEMIHPNALWTVFDNLSPISIVGGVIFGALFIFFEKVFIILYTSAVGAYLIMVHLEAEPVIFYAALVMGTLFQLSMSRGARVKNMQVSQP
jgi:hypothetical protein